MHPEDLDATLSAAHQEQSDSEAEMSRIMSQPVWGHDEQSQPVWGGDEQSQPVWGGDEQAVEEQPSQM